MKHLIRIFVFSFFSFILHQSASAFYLPDTGQTVCYSDKGKEKVTPCPPPGNPLAQDGSYTINPPSYTINANGTVFDNNTWLMWQQQDDGITRTWDEAKNYCENFTLGGHTDWRLPAKKELASIVHYGGSVPSINSSVFLNTKPDNYWSSTIYPSCNTSEAWYVHFGGGIDFRDYCTQRRYKGGTEPEYFQGGNVNFSSKTNRSYARCVRGGPLTFGNFVDNGNGTVTDLTTSLMWQQGETNPMKWGSALNYCEGLSLGGDSDWRLPNVRELESLTDETRIYPSINTRFFPNVKSDNVCGDDQTFFYWTSTTNTSDADNKLVVSFERGFTTSQHKRDRDNFLRCVRGGGSLSLDDREIKVEPSALEFWYAKIGESKRLDLTISNIGRDNLAIGMIASPSAPFSITSDRCSGKTLSALTSCSITVEFNPASEGAFAETITIFSNDADQPGVDVTLKGNANASGVAFYLPDTGQTTCYNNINTVITCPSPENPLAQDGSYLINPPSYTINTDGTVTDNNTKLIWQQVDDGITRTWPEANSYCKNLTLGGYTDWGLPTKSELFSIVDFGQYDPSINSSIFPNTKTDYWSSSSPRPYPDNAWYVFFGQYKAKYCCVGGYCGDWDNYDGVKISYSSKSSTKHYARCVRGKELSFGVFVENGDGTVTDLSTGLMWQQEKADSIRMKWGDALSYCEGITLGGYSDWRLPNVRELESLIDNGQIDPAFYSVLYPDGYCGDTYYWSSTSIHGIFCALFGAWTEAYLVSSTGSIIQDSKSRTSSFYYYPNKARCVRGGNTGLSISGTITGTVTDSVTGLPVSNVSVSVKDPTKIHTTATVSNGLYTVSGLTQGSFSATFEKSGYIKQTVYGTLTAGQTLTLNVQLIPIPPQTIAITSPQDGAMVSSSPIVVTGTVSSNATVTVNGIQASVAGNAFSATIALSEGPNTIAAAATDQYGQTISKSISVTLVTKGTITGTVTDSSTVLPLLSVTVSVTDSLNATQMVLTGSNGSYTITGIASGDFNGSITKDGYTGIAFSGTIYPGEVLNIDVQLTPNGPIIGNLSVSNISTDSATISWTTDQPADSLIEYWTSISYGQSTADSTLTTSHSLSLTNLTPNTTYHFRVASKNASGISSSSTDRTFTTLPLPQAITLTITSPSDGETITRSDITVRGTITNSAGNETGVTVNGMVAAVYGNEFIANHVPLTEGSNTITVAATDTAGNTVTKSITVNAVTTGNYIRLSANPESGIAPLEVTLRIDGSFSIDASSMSVDNATGVEWLSLGYDEYSVRLTAEGIYTFTASVTGPDGIMYQDMVIITVLNKTQLDTLLKAKWEGMKASLANQDIIGALTYFAEDSKQHYNELFAALQSHLPQIVQEMQEIQLIRVRGNSAKYRIRKNDLYGGQTVSITHYIYFLVDSAGIWKIDWY